MTTGDEKPPSKDEQTASLTGGLLFGALFVAAIAVLTYVIIVIWPTKGQATGGTFHLFWGWTWDLDGDQQMLVLVTLAGALGGFVNSLQNLSKYVGDGRLKWRYGLSYLVQPI